MSLGRNVEMSIYFRLSIMHVTILEVAQMVKNPPTIWETWVLSLGWEDPLEKGKATPIFWPGEFHGIVHGVAKSWT